MGLLTKHLSDGAASSEIYHSIRSILLPVVALKSAFLSSPRTTIQGVVTSRPWRSQVEIQALNLKVLVLLADILHAFSEVHFRESSF